MKPNILKVISVGLTIIGGVVSDIAGVTDQKLMTAEIAKQVAETVTKK